MISTLRTAALTALLLALFGAVVYVFVVGAQA